MNNFNGNQVGNLLNNAITTTAILANEVSIQTNGEFLMHEQDYVSLVGNFQLVLSKKIMQPKTADELKDEAKKYITDILKKLNMGNKNDNNDNGDSGPIGESGNVSSSSGEN
jgi:hypothetical protein